MKIKVRKYKNLKAEEHLKTGKRRMVKAVKANDGGLTPVEIIIGVTLLAILSGAVVFQAFQFISRADDSAAKRSLEAAVTAAQGVRNLSATGAGRNFSGAKIGADQASVNSAAVTNISEQLSGASLQAYGAGRFAIAGSDAGTELSNSSGDAQELWLHVNHPKLTSVVLNSVKVENKSRGDNPQLIKLPAGAVIKPGNLIRLGVKSVSGSSFCGVIVTDGTVASGSTQGGTAGTDSAIQRIQGTGWQAVDATQTTKPLNNETAASGKGGAQGGADCGQGAKKNADEFAEMPGILGTDTKLNNPSTSGYGTVA